jgi:hypothetical protein
MDRSSGHPKPRGKRPRVWLAAILLALLGACDPAETPVDAGVERDAASGSDASAPAIAGYLDIASARFDELGPIDFGHPNGREVRVRIEVESAIVCDADHAPSYGVLIDSDLDESTGASNAAFRGLGVDARITAACDPSTGTFSSAAGDVNVDGNAIEITTSVDRLPSVELLFAAYAREGTSFVRLPAGSDVRRFTIIERAMF